MRHLSVLKTRPAARLIAILAALAGAPALSPRPAFAVTFQTIHTFNYSLEGGMPLDDLTVVGSRLFGTLPSGGNAANGSNVGAIFSMNFDGTNYLTHHSFGDGPYPDGQFPMAGLTLVGSKLYGTTNNGGTSGLGTIYSLDSDGSNYQRLYSFTGVANSDRPLTRLTLAGSKLIGGTNQTIFSANLDGTGFQTLRLLNSASDGRGPSSLTLGGSVLYGTLDHGGAHGEGTVFSMNADGSNFQILHAFAGGSGGTTPLGGVTLVGSKLYGTTKFGGAMNDGTVFSLNLDGSNFQILHSFDRRYDGARPEGGLTLLDAHLYGTTTGGITQSASTVFLISLDGSRFETLHSFTASSDGRTPMAGLVVADLTLFGNTYRGGLGAGTVFSLTVPEPSDCFLVPFALAAAAMARRRPRLPQAT